MAAILLLEDEESVNRGIEFTLSKEGYEVYSAETIRGAARILEDQPIDLCICDINLPDGNGLDFIRGIRKKSDMHIICLTALDEEVDQVMGYEAGADDYVIKPFSLSVLILKVNAYFRKRSGSLDRTVESGEWVFHMGEMYAVKHAEKVIFTKNEWKLISMFLNYPKQILSKNQILEQIFEVNGVFADENTVAVNIRRLREKIETDAGEPQYIKNVRGLGYVWNQECRKR